MESDISVTENSANSVGFDLLEVGMKGINSYNDLVVIPFNTKFTSVVGPTGSGKTTILDSLTFSLYGKNSRTDAHLKIREILRLGGYVSLKFMKNGNKYDVKRGLNSFDETYVDLKINDKRFHGNIKATNAEIIRIMGMDYDAFVSSSIIRQGEIKIFSELTPSQRLSKLQNLFQLKVFDKALAKAKEDMKVVEKKITTLKGESDGIKILVDREEEFRDTLGSKSREIIDISKKKLVFESNLANLDGKLEEMRKDKELLSGMSAKKKELESSIADLETQIPILASEIERLEKETEDARSRLPDKERLESMKKVFDRIAELRGEVKSLEMAQASRNEIVNEQKAKYNELLEKYSGGITIDEYTEFAKKLGVAEFKNIKKEIEELEGNIGAKKEDCIKGVVSSVLEKEMEIDGVSNVDLIGEIETLHEKIDFMEGEADGMTASDVDTQLLLSRDLESTISWKEREIREKRSNLKDTEDLLDKKRNDLLELKGEIGSKEEMLHEFESIQEQVQKIRDILMKFEQQIAEARGVMKTVKEDLKKIAEYKELINVNKDKITDLEEEKDLLAEIVTNVLHNRGVTMYAIETVMGAVELRASEILNYMTDGARTLIKFVPVENGFEIYVDEMLAGGRSGGEQTQTNASIRMAIAEKISEMSKMGAKMKTLFIDEGDIGSLDTETARERFIQTIFDLEKYFNKIILITHMPEIADKFGRKIRIEKETVFSKLVA